jgi:hypothetical protein
MSGTIAHKRNFQLNMSQPSIDSSPNIGTAANAALRLEIESLMRKSGIKSEMAIICSKRAVRMSMESRGTPLPHDVNGDAGRLMMDGIQFR